MNIQHYIHVAEADVFEKAARMPASYLEDCRAVAVIDPVFKNWSFPPSDFFRLRNKYRGYAVSEADRYEEGQIISGCCDRADQY
jgi:hypothetical protein